MPLLEARGLTSLGESAEGLQQLLAILGKGDGAVFEQRAGGGQGIGHVAGIEIGVGLQVGAEALGLSAQGRLGLG